MSIRISIVNAVTNVIQSIANTRINIASSNSALQRALIATLFKPHYNCKLVFTFELLIPALYYSFYSLQAEENFNPVGIANYL